MIQTQIINWVTANPQIVLGFLGGGAGLSVALQVILHKLHIDSKVAAYTLAHLFSIAIAVAAWYLDNVNAVGSYAALVIIAQTVHRFAVSPYYNKYVVPYLNYLAQTTATSTSQLAQPLPSETETTPTAAAGFVA